MRLRLTLEYDGSAFQGWQVQPRGATVQGALETAFRSIARVPVRVIGAGRTDSGVHARGQVAHCDLPDPVAAERGGEWRSGGLRRGLNAVLPGAVAVLDVARVAPEFDARRDAVRKRYRYRIVNRRPASPLRASQSWHVRSALDLGAMREAAAGLLGTRDFAAFRGAPGGPPADERTERTLDRLDVLRRGDEVQIVAEARSFLRYMVRNLVGALVEVGWGRLEPGALIALAGSGDRSRAPATAPAQGLCLEQIWYPGDPIGGEPRPGEAGSAAPGAESEALA